MKKDPKFSSAWKAAIIAAIALPLLAGGAAERRRQADERRFEAIEKSTKKIEAYLYKEVAPAIQSR